MTLANSAPRYTAELIRSRPEAVFWASWLCTWPRVVWLIANDFPTFAYAAQRAGSDAGAWSDRIVYPLRFLIGQAPIVLPALLIIVALGWPKRGGALDNENTRFLFFIGFGPIVVTLLLSAVVGFKERSMWGTPLLLTSGLMLIGWFGPAVTSAGLRRFTWAWTGIFAVALTAFMGTVLLRPFFYDTGKRTHFPGTLMAQTLTTAWRDRFNSPVPVIVGEPGRLETRRFIRLTGQVFISMRTQKWRPGSTTRMWQNLVRSSCGSARGAAEKQHLLRRRRWWL